MVSITLAPFTRKIAGSNPDTSSRMLWISLGNWVKKFSKLIMIKVCYFSSRVKQPCSILKLN